MAVSNSTDRFNGVVASKAIKVPCKVATTTNITLSGAQTVAGVPVVTGDRVLVRAQTNAVENGIYIVDSGAWERAADWDGNRDIVQGTLATAFDSGGNAYQYIVTTPDPITIGTTALTIDIYTSGASAVIDPGTVESSMLRWDGAAAWSEETLIRGTDAGELRVYETNGIDYLEFSYSGTVATAELLDPTHTIQFNNDVVIQGSDIILDSGDIILGGGTISGAGWLLPFDTPIQWEDDTTPTPVPQELLIFTGSTPGGEPDSDPNFGNVTMLLSFENAAVGASSFTSDVGGIVWTEGSGGSAECRPTNAYAKYGTKSLGNTSVLPGVNIASQQATAGAWSQFGTGDFTIEMDVLFDSTITGSAAALISNWIFNQYGWIMYFTPSIALNGGRMGWSHTTDGTSGTTQGPGSSQIIFDTLAYETWYHIAVTRESGTVRLWFEGVQIGSDSAAAGSIHNSTHVVEQHASDNHNSNVARGVWTDNIRITKGVARYSAPFTPPSKPYQGSATILNFSVGDPAYDLLLDGTNVIADAQLTVTDGVNTTTFVPNSVGLSAGDRGLSAGQFAVQDGVGNSRIVWSNTAGDDSISAEADGARLHFKNQTGLFTSVRFGEDPFPVNVDVSGGDLIISGYLAGANEEKVLSFQDSGGTEYAHMKTTGTGALQIRNVSQDDSFEFIGTYTGGTTQTFLSWNPNSHTNLKSPTGRDLQLYAGELLGMKIDNLGAIDFYYSGNSIAQITSEAGGGLSVKQTDTGETGVFSRVQVQYDLGADGEFWFYDYSSTFMGDPTQARFRLDNADPSLVTNIALDDLTISNRDFGGILSQIQSGTQIRLTETTDLGRWAAYEATGVATDNTGWWQIAVSYIAHAGTFPGTTRDPFKFTFSNLTGAPAAAGGSPSTRLVYRFEYNDGQTGGVDPGTGLIHFSNLTPTSSNRMAISQTDLDGRDIGPVITDAWQGGRGAMVRMSKVGDPETYMHWVVNERSDQGTWDWTYINMDEWEGTWTDGDEMLIEFEFQPFVERPQTDHSVLMSNAILSGQPRCGWEEQPDIRLSGGGGSGVYLFSGATEIARITGSGTTQMRFTTQNLANLGSFRFESDTVSFYDKSGTLPRFSIENNSNRAQFGHGNDVGNGAPTLWFRERTSQPAMSAGWGSIWVRSDTPNSLMFTADDGTDYDLTDAGATATTISAGWTTGSGGSLTIAANAPLFYTEQATDDTPGAGQGQVWVRNDTPNTLMFTDDAGTDFVIGGAAAPSGITGTVADNQIVVGTGASTVDSSSELTYNDVTGDLIHNSGLATSLLQTGISANVHTQINVSDNFTEFQFSDDSVDTSVARILFNINSASTGVHEYWFRDNDGTYLTIDCTNQQLTFAGRLGLIAQNDHGVTFSSGEGQIWAKSRSQGDDLMFTADDYREDISLLSVMTHCYVFDNATAAADPGAGEFRLNNATPASVTQVYVNDADDGGRDATYMLSNLGVGDIITFRQSNNTARYFTARVNAAPTDNTGWWTIPVTPIHTDQLFSLGNPAHLEVQWLSRVSTLTTDLDVNGNDIVSNVTNGNIYLIPNGTGVVAVRSGKTFRVYDGDNSDYIQMWHDGTDGRLTANGGVINLADETIHSAVLQDYSVENVSTTPTGTTETITYSDGPSFEIDLESVTGNVTVTISGGPVSGNYGQIVCKITQDSATARTVTWAGGTFRWAGGTAHPMNTTLDGFTIYSFETWDGGTTWWGAGADYA